MNFNIGDKVIPKQYAQLVKEFESKKDPEYQKYLELKKKFEGE